MTDMDRAIDSAQQRINEAKKEASEKLQPYEALYQQEVDRFQQLDSSLNLKSDEARKHFEKGKIDINADLLELAKAGEVLGKAPDAPSAIPGLAKELQGSLNEYKADLANFSAIAEVERLDAALESGAPTDSAAKLLSAKKTLLEKLPVANGASSAYREKVAQDVQKDIEALSTFLKDQNFLVIESDKVTSYQQAAAIFEKTPSDQNLTAIRAKQKDIQLEQLGDDVFNGKIERPDWLGARYQNLWEQEFTPLKKRFEAVRDKIDAREKEGMSAQATLAIAVVEKSWEMVLQPKIDQYARVDVTTDYFELEKGLLSDLLKTKSFLGPFLHPENKDKIQFELLEKISLYAGKIDRSISQIERQRQARDLGLELRQRDMLKYIRYEKDSEKVYSFSEAYYELSPNEQARIRFYVEGLDGAALAKSKRETAQAALEFLNPEEKLKKMNELLGSKGQPYFDALEKLKGQDIDGAIAAFQAYLAQSFSPEDLKLHAETIADAREKIQGVYIEKLNLVDDLFQDVRTLFLTRRKNAGSAELTVEEGQELQAIEREIAKFRQEVQQGSVKDFNDRFGDLQRTIRAKLKERPNGDGGMLAELADLYDLSQEKDPEKRKKGFFEFAKKARGTKAYDLARKYLDYALEQDFKKYSQDFPKEKVLEGMLKDPKFLKDLREEARKRYQEIVAANPELKDSLSIEIVQQQLLRREVDEKYKLALRRRITPPDFTGSQLEQYDAALAAYNDWFPLDQPDWYRPWDYGAEEWDQFQVDCVKFVFEQLPAFGTGLLAGVAGKAGAKWGGKAVLKYLMRSGLKEAEIALIEEGGLQALRAATQSGKALSYGATRLAGSIAMEGSTLYLANMPLEYLQTGQVADLEALGVFGSNLLKYLKGESAQFNSSPGKRVFLNLSESMMKASVLKIMGFLSSQIAPLQRAMQRGGATGAMAWMGNETLSGVGGAIMDYAVSQVKNQHMSGQEFFMAVVSNYLVSLGMSAAHGPKIGEKKTEQMNERYWRGRISDRFADFGIDSAKPETIRTARILSDGKLIVNGKIIPDITVQNFQFMPQAIRDRIVGLSARNKIPTHGKGNFSKDVPDSLWLPEGWKTDIDANGQRIVVTKDGNEMNYEDFLTTAVGKASHEKLVKNHGWIGTDGQIHYNIDYLNRVAHGQILEKGVYRTNPRDAFLPDGWSLGVDAQGNLLIRKDTGDTMGYREFRKQFPEQGEKLAKVLETIRSHEVTHRLIEGADQGGILSNDIQNILTKNDELTEAFRLSRHALDQEGVQEFLCGVADGNIKLSPDAKALLETTIGKYIPEFAFSKVRSIDIKTLALPDRVVSRAKAAAKEGGSDALLAELYDNGLITENSLFDALKKRINEDGKPKSLQDLKKMVDLIEVSFELHPYNKTKQFILDLLSLNQTLESRSDLLGKFMSDYPGIPKDTILQLSDRLYLKYRGEYEHLSEQFADKLAKGGIREALAYGESLPPLQREFFKLIAKESADTSKLLTEAGKVKDGFNEPFEILKQHIDSGRKGLGKQNLDILLKSPLGRQILGELIRNPEVAKKLISTAEGVDCIKEQLRLGHIENFKDLLPQVKEVLIQDMVSSFHDKAFRIEPYEAMLKFVAKFNEAKLRVAFQKLLENKDFAAQEGLPSLADVLIANHENLSLDYFQKLLKGDVEYKSVEYYENGETRLKKIILVEGDHLGTGAMGKVYKNLVIDSKTPQLQEGMVTKRPLHSLDIKNNPEYLKLDTSDQSKLNAILDKFKGDDLVDMDNFSKAREEIEDLLKRNPEVNAQPILDDLARIRYTRLEARNMKLIMKYQSMGKLKGLMKPHYTAADDGLLIMESQADGYGNVRSLEAIQNGELKASAGFFWRAVADSIDTLDEMHQLWLLHHDVKPHNIVISPKDGRARIVDFGSMLTREDLPKIPFGIDIDEPTKREKKDAALQGPNVHYGVLQMNYNTTGWETTPRYTDPRICYREAKGIERFGRSDEDMIVKTFERDFLSEDEDTGTFQGLPEEYLPADKRAPLKALVERFKNGTIDAPAFANGIRTLMQTPP